MVARRQGPTDGPATDRLNEPVKDPSPNVLDLVEAANRRQDDLRISEASHIREIIGLRDKHLEELRKAESRRIDAIRSLDVASVERNAQISRKQINALMTQISETAEAMRVSDVAVSEATARALTSKIAPLSAAIDSLRQTQYQLQGERAQIQEEREKDNRRSTLVGLIIAAAAVFSSFILGAAGIVITFLLKGG